MTESDVVDLSDYWLGYYCNFHSKIYNIIIIVGQFKLPVSCLVERSEKRNIRQPDMLFVEA